VKFGLIRTVPKDECELEGSFYGYVSPRSIDPQSGWYPLLIDISDFDSVRDRIRAPSILQLQVAAFPNQVDIFADDTSYYSPQPKGAYPRELAKESTRAMDLEQMAEKVDSARLATESFIPSGLFEPGGRPKNPLKAEGIMTGHIEECSTLTNPFSGRPFYRTRVRTYAATFDVVCDPARLRTVPAPRNVLSGVFWFTGQLVGPLAETGNH